MRLLVTGASSFVGAHFCRLAAAHGHTVIGLYRSTPLSLAGVRGVQLDLGGDRAAVELARLDADAVVHLACKVKGTGNGRQETESTRLNTRMLDRVLELELPLVYASSTCVHWPQDSGYATGRRQDEARIEASGVPFATLRPCAPYGPALSAHRPSHTESFHTLAQWVKRSPLVPVMGDGSAYRRQPIHVDDFNGAALRLLEQGLPNRAFDAGGADALTMDGLIQALARHLGTRALPVHLPKKALITAVSAMSADFEPDLLDTADVDDVADPAALEAAAGMTMRTFGVGLPDLYRTV